MPRIAAKLKIPQIIHEIIENNSYSHALFIINRIINLHLTIYCRNFFSTVVHSLQANIIIYLLNISLLTYTIWLIYAVNAWGNLSLTRSYHDHIRQAKKKEQIWKVNNPFSHLLLEIYFSSLSEKIITASWGREGNTKKRMNILIVKWCDMNIINILSIKL